MTFESCDIEQVRLEHGVEFQGKYRGKQLVLLIAVGKIQHYVIESLSRRNTKIEINKQLSKKITN